jgi:glycine cleavage system H protein
LYPTEARYTKSHEWVIVTNDVAKVGITHYASGELGDIVNVDLPAPETLVHAGDPCGSVDAVKAVSDIFSPVTGTVLEANGKLATRPELINEDPHDAGWLIRVRVEDLSELDGLMASADYEQFIKSH